MSAPNAAQERRAAWLDALELYGYEADVSWLSTSMTGFEIHARRPQSYGAPEVSLAIGEVWRAGADPISTVQRSFHGAYMEAGKAHAQVLSGQEGAHRVDVGDPNKPPALTIHLHPFGKPNDVRLPLPAIPVPEQWIHTVEVIAAQVAAGLTGGSAEPVMS